MPSWRRRGDPDVPEGRAELPPTIPAGARIWRNVEKRCEYFQWLEYQPEWKESKAGKAEAERRDPQPDRGAAEVQASVLDRDGKQRSSEEAQLSSMWAAPGNYQRQDRRASKLESLDLASFLAEETPKSMPGTPRSMPSTPGKRSSNPGTPTDGDQRNRSQGIVDSSILPQSADQPIDPGGGRVPAVSPMATVQGSSRRTSAAAQRRVARTRSDYDPESS